MNGAKRTVELPDELCTRLEEQFGKSFPNLEELLVYVMSELTRDHGSQLDVEEQKILEQRLRDLGYL
jgi:hypothetical protein